jgi:hypothetical protein
MFTLLLRPNTATDNAIRSRNRRKPTPTLYRVAFPLDESDLSWLSSVPPDEYMDSFAIKPRLSKALGLEHTQRHGSYGKMSYDLFAVRHPFHTRATKYISLFSDCRTVDVACRHVWKLRLHFIVYYLMRHEPYGRRATVVAVCVPALVLQLDAVA